MRSLLTILILFSVAGCEAAIDQERLDMEEKISSVIQIDWHDGIPLDDLFKVKQLCQQHPSLRGCKAVKKQIQDIADTVATCLKDQRSDLCQAAIENIKNHDISKMLPPAKAVNLPDDPFYFFLPTEVLESQANRFNYRLQALGWWWETWKIRIILYCTLIILTYFAWNWWTAYEEEQAQQAAEQYTQRKAIMQQEKARLINEERERIEVEHRTKIEQEAAIAEQQRQAAEKLAQMKAAKALAKLADEQSQIDKILDVTFKPVAKQRRKKKLD